MRSVPAFSRFFLLTFVAAAATTGGSSLVGAASSSSTLAPWPTDTEIRLNQGEMVHTSGIFQVLESDAFAGEDPAVIYVESDIPVVAGRLTAGSSAFIEPPIEWGSAMVILKSNCAEGGMSLVYNIENSTMANGKDYSLKISTMITTDGSTTVVNSKPYMDSSALFKQLKCFSQVGPPCEPPPATVGSPPEPPTATNATATGAPETTTPPAGQEINQGDGLASSTSQAATITTKASMLLTFLLIGFSALFSSSAGSITSSRFVASGMLGAAAIFCLMILSPSHAEAKATATTTTTTTATRSLQEEGGGQCSVQVEIVYWGCTTILNVNSPAGMVLRNLHQTTTQDRETCNCTSLSTFPDLDEPRDMENPYIYLDHDANNSVAVDGSTPGVYTVPTADSSNCRIAIGRPFRDEYGTNIQSVPNLLNKEEATTVNTEPIWSKEDRQLLKRYNSNIPPPSTVTTTRTTTTADDSSSFSSSWVQQALGEHASVASFAAFTIALMSNGAPPYLVEGALDAAQDELRHAQLSFLIASRTLLLLNDHQGNNNHHQVAVEPLALPPSSHKFGYDLMALAKSVIEEGCIDETLSALQIAADYDDYHQQQKKNPNHDLDDKEDPDAWIYNITRTIALEEGKHSILAWRTIQWICNNDDDHRQQKQQQQQGTTTTTSICSDLMAEYLNTERLLAIGMSKHDASSTVYRAWKCLAPVVACLATTTTTTTSSSSSSIDHCKKLQEKQEHEELCPAAEIKIGGDDQRSSRSSLVHQLVQEIQEGVTMTMMMQGSAAAEAVIQKED